MGLMEWAISVSREIIADSIEAVVAEIRWFYVFWWMR